MITIKEFAEIFAKAHAKESMGLFSKMKNPEIKFFGILEDWKGKEVKMVIKDRFETRIVVKGLKDKFNATLCRKVEGDSTLHITYLNREDYARI